MTPVDSLDTMILMGLADEANRTRAFLDVVESAGERLDPGAARRLRRVLRTNRRRHRERRQATE